MDRAERWAYNADKWMNVLHLNEQKQKQKLNTPWHTSYVEGYKYTIGFTGKKEVNIVH